MAGQYATTAQAALPSVQIAQAPPLVQAAQMNPTAEVEQASQGMSMPLVDRISLLEEWTEQFAHNVNVESVTAVWGRNAALAARLAQLHAEIRALSSKVDIGSAGSAGLTTAQTGSQDTGHPLPELHRRLAVVEQWIRSIWSNFGQRTVMLEAQLANVQTRTQLLTAHRVANEGRPSTSQTSSAKVPARVLLHDVFVIELHQQLAQGASEGDLQADRTHPLEESLQEPIAPGADEPEAHRVVSVASSDENSEILEDIVGSQISTVGTAQQWLLPAASELAVSAREEQDSLAGGPGLALLANVTGDDRRFGVSLSVPLEGSTGPCMTELVVPRDSRPAGAGPRPLEVTADEFRVLSAMEGGLSSALLHRGLARSLVIENDRPGLRRAANFRPLDPGGEVNHWQPDPAQVELTDCEVHYDRVKDWAATRTVLLKEVRVNGRQAGAMKGGFAQVGKASLWSKPPSFSAGFNLTYGVGRGWSYMQLIWQPRGTPLKVKVILVYLFAPTHDLSGTNSDWLAVLLGQLTESTVPTLLAGDFNLAVYESPIVKAAIHAGLVHKVLPQAVCDQPTTTGARGNLEGKAFDCYLGNVALRSIARGGEVVQTLGSWPHFGVEMRGSIPKGDICVLHMPKPLQLDVTKFQGAALPVGAFEHSQDWFEHW
eukprot:6486330-Amphidinium_carterae.2